MTERDTWTGETLRAYRNKRGWTQQKLSDESTVDRSAIVNLEKGARKLTPHYAKLLAKPLKVKVADLLPVMPPQPVEAKTPLDRLEELEVEVAEIWAGSIALLRLVDLLAAQVVALGGTVPRNVLEETALAMLRTQGGTQRP